MFKPQALIRQNRPESLGYVSYILEELLAIPRHVLSPSLSLSSRNCKLVNTSWQKTGLTTQHFLAKNCLVRKVPASFTVCTIVQGHFKDLALYFVSVKTHLLNNQSSLTVGTFISFNFSTANRLYCRELSIFSFLPQAVQNSGSSIIIWSQCFSSHK